MLFLSSNYSAFSIVEEEYIHKNFTPNHMLITQLKESTNPVLELFYTYTSFKMKQTSERDWIIR